MVDKTSDQSNPGTISLVQLVRDWLSINKPGSAWHILPDSPFKPPHDGTILDGYGWYFSIYADYLTAGIGVTPIGERYDTGFLIDAADPEFFNKLKVKLDSIEATYPERHASMLQAASDALARIESAKRLLPKE